MRDPWKPFKRTGWIALGLGTLNLLGFAAPDPLLLLDFPGLCLSVMSGWALLRRFPSALVATAIAGGTILADALVSIVLIGPLLFRMLLSEQFFSDEEAEMVRAIVLRRLFLYGVQILFWPFAAVLVMRDLRRRGLPKAYAAHTRDTVIGAF